jgi:hypothetical protein
MEGVEVKKILIISMSDISRDPRVKRQVNTLNEHYMVDTLDYGGYASAHRNYVFYEGYDKKLMKRAAYLKTHQYDKYRNTTFRYTDPHTEYDLIIANDNDSLPIAFDLKSEAKIIHDAHEFSPEQQSDDLKWKFFMQGYRKWVCKKYLNRCDKVLTVSDGVADLYKKAYGISPEVITSASEYCELSPTKIGMRSDKIRIIHHGISNPPRKIEKLIEMMGYINSRYSLTLMLVDRAPKYTEKLKKMAWDSSNSHNISFRNPVPADIIAESTNEYDIGMFIAQPSNMNLKYTLPNKFFEFVQARLMIATGPSPEMEKLIKQYDMGIVSKDFTPKTMAENLNSLSADDIYKYKLNTDTAAKVLNSTENMKRLTNIVKELIGE